MLNNIFKNGFIFLKCNCRDFFRKLYWFYGFLRKCADFSKKMYGFFQNKPTDCTVFSRKLYGFYGFFFENCTDFFWKWTDFFKKVLATLRLTLGRFTLGSLTQCRWTLNLVLKVFFLFHLVFVVYIQIHPNHLKSFSDKKCGNIFLLFTWKLFTSDDTILFLKKINFPRKIMNMHSRLKKFSRVINPDFSLRNWESNDISSTVSNY